MTTGAGDAASLEAVRRCRAVLDAMAAGTTESYDLAGFRTDLETLPAGHPRRGELAATMITLLTGGGGAPPTSAMADIGPLLDMVDSAPPHLLAWPRARASARAFQLVHDTQERRATAASAVAELDELAARHGDFLPTLNAIETARKGIKFDVAFQRGDDSSKLGIIAQMGQLLDRIGDVPQAGPMREMQAALHDLLDAQQNSDWAAVSGLLDRLRASSAAAGLDPAEFAMPADGEAMLKLLSDAESGSAELTTEEILRRHAGEGSGPAGKITAASILTRGWRETDLKRIELAIELLRQAAAEPGPMQDIARNGIAVHLWRRAEVLGTLEGLDEAQEVLEDLIRDLRDRGGPGSPLWSDVHELLGHIKQRVGDQQGSGDVSFEAMYRFAHKALMESDPAIAREGLREAAALGMQIARHRVQVEDFRGALDALDAGRGLMLFAEVEMLDLVPRLRAAGRDDLVRRWEEEGPASPGLRTEAIDVLVNAAGGVDKLLKKSSPADIRAALRTVDADALVYLVPADQQQPGLALVVPREGQLAYLPLSYLDVERGAGAGEDYLSALSHLSRELSPAVQAPFTDRLDDLCDWAWRVAIGPLLERYFARDAAKRGRVPRIVLVPMAKLADIPWQAARNREGTYALELAAFSLAVSAREFCANAARPPVRLTSTGLVVGDPDTAGSARDLPAARLEAFEIHKAFLRAAKYVGRRPTGSVSPSGAGTAGQVRSWLAAGGPHAGAVLHLACHGQFSSRKRAAKACLVLAPDSAGAPGELGADEIVRLLHSTPDRQIGLVVMAACHTARSIHGYDEAYSLGTAFLAGGVRTVLSTQWAVPDEATSMLMYLFHHYLRTEKLPPWQALRAAQLCLIRPDTPMPEAMPAHLRELAADREHTGVVGWAGFVHAGH
ncbi:CHAT domain-containing protein [Amycolatopsis sp. A133]|uniref:CHAT domain-containing protein n=1 Tax=Amycolatopsis sp. A133 TaxID=3064472 RepID=UPI0027FB0FCF|nr:CHAT domain-containing protein [Amycolatopsis sp. A133]MDQ7803302.1 CHAT domain-containing protein [Amycolatopsis sp. A133]